MRAVLLVALLAGCASAPKDPAVVAEAHRPLICKDKAQCDLYWSRAQAWVANNGGYRIQTVSDSVISTYGPFGGKVDLASQVTREAAADGSARIRIRLSCDNLFGCRPTPEEGAVSFKRYVTR